MSGLLTSTETLWGGGCSLLDPETASKVSACVDAAKFAEVRQLLREYIEQQKSDNKAEVEALPKREQKRRREALASQVCELEAFATIADEAVWLTEKFGEGEYRDIPGLCKIATRSDIKGDQDAEKSSWSLTPGAYVGVPPVEDDGVDFHERMREIHAELLELQAESNQLLETISINFKEMGL